MGKNLPKVSIVIPVYNGANYLHEAIHSALTQTYSNIEIIVVNDGSRDEGETEKIALSYGNRIRYFHKENGGVATALNLGIRYMTGEYFSWLSHDDMYTPEKIERQMEILEKVTHDTILFGGYELINEKSEKFAQVDPGTIYPEVKLNIPVLPLLRGLINGCALLIHKSHFKRVGLFDPALRSTQDYDLWFKMFRGAKIKYHQGLYVKTRSHSEQGTKKSEHEEDCSKLWIYMMDNINDDEMCEIDGSVYSFRKNQEKFLKESTPFATAIAYSEILSKQAELDIEQIRDNCKVSVIIPFNNRISLLIKSIESVLNQSHSNFEIILIDDGTTDDLTPVRKLMKKEKKRIRFFIQDHKGASAARNLGMEKACGDYIAFLDSDDLFERDKLKIQLEYMIRNGYEFSHTSYQKITIDGDFLETVNSNVFSGRVFPRILSDCPIATPTVMIKRSIIKDKRFKEEFLICGEDTCFWIDIAFKYPLWGLDQALTLVRISETSAAYNLDKQRIGLLNIVTHLIRNPMYIPYEKEIYSNLSALSSLFNRDIEINPMAKGLLGEFSFINNTEKNSSRLKRWFIKIWNRSVK
ncbi:glycosyltransferase family 2 protein [Cohnella suwonensis]|uniref:Glycosyltransferase family 2 protein n=1 Tax=Cohnella suwonensis TaxID=696072 RepID=A0ABW0LU84_9BACL